MAAKPIESRLRLGPIERLFEDYERDPNIGRAADLLSAAVVQGLRNDAVVSVATAILETSTHAILRDLAYGIVEGDAGRLTRAFRVDPIESRARVAVMKAILRREPRNSVRWVDLAREYVTLGQVEQARVAMRIARALAPDDRFVLRSAGAMYVHLDEPDLALALLNGSEATPGDPWLLAPTIAIADLAGVKHLRMKDARRVIDDGDFPEMHLTELAAALGTVELASGTSRRARQLLRHSLLQPTENVLAQVEWLARRTGDVLLKEMPTAVPRQFEAQARRARNDSRWPEAVKSAECWLVDQPFSLEAAIFGSSSACIAEDWLAVGQFVSAGLEANPNDAGLLNNRAVAQIEQGKLVEAVETLRVAAQSDASRNIRAVLSATAGLALFRLGFVEEGRSRYKVAMDAFGRLSNRDNAAVAALMLAREEFGAGTERADAAFKDGKRLARQTTESSVRTCEQRVEMLISRPANKLDLPLGQLQMKQLAVDLLSQAPAIGIDG